MPAGIEMGQIITVAPGTEINTAAHEDSESVIAQKRVKLRVVAPEQDGALQVTFIGHATDVPTGQIFYYHQPSKN
jgi:hypothetical protein